MKRTLAEILKTVPEFKTGELVFILSNGVFGTLKKISIERFENTKKIVLEIENHGHRYIVNSNFRDIFTVSEAAELGFYQTGKEPNPYEDVKQLFNEIRQIDINAAHRRIKELEKKLKDEEEQIRERNKNWVETKKENIYLKSENQRLQKTSEFFYTMHEVSTFTTNEVFEENAKLKQEYKDLEKEFCEVRDENKKKGADIFNLTKRNDILKKANDWIKKQYEEIKSANEYSLLRIGAMKLDINDLVSKMKTNEIKDL